MILIQISSENFENIFESYIENFHICWKHYFCIWKYYFQIIRERLLIIFRERSHSDSINKFVCRKLHILYMSSLKQFTVHHSRLNSRLATGNFRKHVERKSELPNRTLRWTKSDGRHNTRFIARRQLLCIAASDCINAYFV